jgi:hypothetical protein
MAVMDAPEGEKVQVLSSFRRFHATPPGHREGARVV